MASKRQILSKVLHFQNYLANSTLFEFDSGERAKMPEKFFRVFPIQELLQLVTDIENYSTNLGYEKDKTDNTLHNIGQCHGTQAR